MAIDNDPRLRISRDIARRRKQRRARCRDGELRDMVLEIDTKGIGLSDWEVEFIGDLVDKDIDRFSEKQEAQIRRIYEERV